jgi:hypothetical protein
MADDRRHSSLPYPLARVTGLALALVLTVVGAQGAEEFQRLSAREIRAQIIGNVITDEAHWSHHFRPNGTLQAGHVEDPRGYALPVTHHAQAGHHDRVL